MKKYDFAVFIGRFSPFHEGHKQVISTALDIAKEVIVLIGSSKRPRTIRNPWSFDERKNMIMTSFSPDKQARLQIVPLLDYMYNDHAWVTQVQQHVTQLTPKEAKIAIIGHAKDKTSYYLKLFPQWDLISTPLNEEVHAVDIRTLLFEQKTLLYLKSLLPSSTYEFLNQFISSSKFAELLDEYNFIKTYKSSWNAAPYPPTFVTSDAIVVQSGHVLLITRKAAPGKGLFALPGGFIAQDEYIIDGMLRKLKEETKIDIPLKVLSHSIVHQQVYDHPIRSFRGRTITHGFLIHLSAGGLLPKVKGAGDAISATWKPINEIRSEECFEDHYDIIHHMIGKL